MSDKSRKWGAVNPLGCRPVVRPIYLYRRDFLVCRLRRLIADLLGCKVRLAIGL
jgi:hypothetical protein